MPVHLAPGLVFAAGLLLSAKPALFRIFHPVIPGIGSAVGQKPGIFGFLIGDSLTILNAHFAAVRAFVLAFFEIAFGDQLRNVVRSFFFVDFIQHDLAVDDLDQRTAPLGADDLFLLLDVGQRDQQKQGNDEHNDHHFPFVRTIRLLATH